MTLEFARIVLERAQKFLEINLSLPSAPRDKGVGTSGRRTDRQTDICFRGLALAASTGWNNRITRMSYSCVVIYHTVFLFFFFCHMTADVIPLSHCRECHLIVVKMAQDSLFRNSFMKWKPSLEFG